jgi:hypothetical protein
MVFKVRENCKFENQLALHLNKRPWCYTTDKRTRFGDFSLALHSNQIPRCYAIDKVRSFGDFVSGNDGNQ